MREPAERGDQILLIDVTVETAMATAERIRCAVEGLRLTTNDIDLGDILRVSVGVAMYPEHGDDLQALISVADAALYTAKQHGRNRVVSAGLTSKLASSHEQHLANSDTDTPMNS